MKLRSWFLRLRLQRVHLQLSLDRGQDIKMRTKVKVIDDKGMIKVRGIKVNISVTENKVRGMKVKIRAMVKVKIKFTQLKKSFVSNAI